MALATETPLARPEKVDDLRRSVERHYDSLALLYRTFWGKHIHHGYWETPDLSPEEAQERLVALLAARARIRPGDRVLDVGCGYGASGRWLAGSLGCDVTGVTISRRQARLARRYNLRAGSDGRTAILRADASCLPLAAGAFDVVWSVECVEHLTDKGRFIQRTARMLRPGGRFALCTWQRGDGIPASEPLVREICEAFLCPSLATERDYRAWCREAGLEVGLVEDLTPQVRPTWEVLVRRLHRPWLTVLRPFLNRGLRRFVEGFPKIDEAFATGAMKYGLLVAARSPLREIRR